MRDELFQRLAAFQRENKIQSKGQLAVIIHLCRVAREQGLPLDSTRLVTEAGGQVRGLGKAAVQKVLKDYGIVRVLAEESGRTSRGSLGLMTVFVEFLNGLHSAHLADTAAIESWWIDRIRDYFNSRPFTLRYDTSRSLRAVVRDLLLQAEARQKESPGTTYMGTVLQHLAGAKLSIVLPQGSLAFHGASVADSPTARSGDFLWMM